MTPNTNKHQPTESIKDQVLKHLSTIRNRKELLEKLTKDTKNYDQSTKTRI